MVLPLFNYANQKENAGREPKNLSNRTEPIKGAGRYRKMDVSILHQNPLKLSVYAGFCYLFTKILTACVI